MKVIWNVVNLQYVECSFSLAGQTTWHDINSNVHNMHMHSIKSIFKINWNSHRSTHPLTVFWIGNTECNLEGSLDHERQQRLVCVVSSVQHVDHGVTELVSVFKLGFLVSFMLGILIHFIVSFFQFVSLPFEFLAYTTVCLSLFSVWSWFVAANCSVDEEQHRCWVESWG